MEVREITGLIVGIASLAIGNAASAWIAWRKGRTEHEQFRCWIAWITGILSLAALIWAAVDRESFLILYHPATGERMDSDGRWWVCLAFCGAAVLASGSWILHLLRRKK